jgi:hypothetical protein
VSLWGFLMTTSTTEGNLPVEAEGAVPDRVLTAQQLVAAYWDAQGATNSEIAAAAGYTDPASISRLRRKPWYVAERDRLIKEEQKTIEPRAIREQKKALDLHSKALDVLAEHLEARDEENRPNWQVQRAAISTLLRSPLLRVLGEVVPQNAVAAAHAVAKLTIVDRRGETAVEVERVVDVESVEVPSDEG